MLQQEHEAPIAKGLEVSIDIRREEAGFMSAYVYRLDGTLIVMTPPCDSQDGAVLIAKEMFRRGELAIPSTFSIIGTA